MFADGHLLTQLIPIFFLILKIKRCFENLVILLTWIRLDPDPDPDTINPDPHH